MYEVGRLSGLELLHSSAVLGWSYRHRVIPRISRMRVQVHRYRIVCTQSPCRTARTERRHQRQMLSSPRYDDFLDHSMAPDVSRRL